MVHSTDKSIANHLVWSRFEVTVFGEPAKGCYISCDELCASSLSRIETKCLNYDGRLGVIEVFHCCNEVSYSIVSSRATVSKLPIRQKVADPTAESKIDFLLFTSVILLASK